MPSYETHLALAQERHDATLAPDPISPDCEQGKHRACSGDAWDDRTDEPADCACDCHDDEDVPTGATAWRVVRMSGGSRTITHPFIAVAPGCPTDRHPTRDCGCKVHRTADAARAYIAEKEAS